MQQVRSRERFQGSKRGGRLAESDAAKTESSEDCGFAGSEGFAEGKPRLRERAVREESAGVARAFCVSGSLEGSGFSTCFW